MFANMVLRPKHLGTAFPAIAISILIVLINLSWDAAATRNPSCATLYSAENYAGNKVDLKPYQQISALTSHHINSIEEWNTTSSLQIKNGCSLVTCSEKYFRGNCKSYAQNAPSLSSEFQMIGSANCSCHSIQTCQDVRLKGSDCARGYFDNSCNFFYTDFRNSWAWIDAPANQFTSVIVRQGCKLEAYEEDGYEGNSQILEGVNEGWNQTINSFSCSCTGQSVAVEGNDTAKVRPRNYPPLLDVPSSKCAIATMLQERTVGLLSALKSAQSQRSPKNAYILILGLYGSGKTSFINLFLENTKTMKRTRARRLSQETVIQEFRIPVQLDELGIANSELHLIEVPGFGDTRGLEEDAKLLASLEDYLNRHEELSKYVPNVVLIFAKFNVFYASAFITMLRGIDLFRDKLTQKDSNFSNVIFVLTHYMSETRTNVRNPSNRIETYKKTILNYSLLPKPISIVLAENRGQDNGLALFNGNYKLPNGDLYPQNLADKIQQLTRLGGDPIGEAVIRTAFENADQNLNGNVTFRRLVDSSDRRVVPYLEALSAPILPNAPIQNPPDTSTIPTTTTIEPTMAENPADHDIKLLSLESQLSAKRFECILLEMQISRLKANWKPSIVIGAQNLTIIENQPGCLKKGTKIRAQNGTQIPVEDVQVGDMVLDKDLIPSRVFGKSAWFLGNQKFFGFGNGPQFFTATHMFVGADKFHVIDKKYLLEINPLMRYLDVEEFPAAGKFNVSKFDSEIKTVGRSEVELAMDSAEYPPHTLVYFIQVESKSGTYFANDFVCRHEIPPFEHWPKTMATIFLAVLDERVQFVKELDYTAENLSIIQAIVENVFQEVQNILKKSTAWAEYSESNSSSEVDFKSFDVTTTMGNILEQDTFATMAIGIYSTCGPMMAEVLEFRQESPHLQNTLMNAIVNVVSNAKDKFNSQHKP